MSNQFFVETEFVEGELPTSTKLNTMIQRISNALAMCGEAISMLCGDDRVIDDPDSATELTVVASSPADMYVNVNTGYGVVSSTLVRNETAAKKLIVAPTTSNRYTIIQISNAGVITTKDGTEAGSPVEPDADTDNIKLAAIYLPQNTTKIEDSDGGYGYIIDRRDISTITPGTISRHVTFVIMGVVFTDGGPNGDGYYLGSSGGDGYTFGEGVTIQKATIQAREAPSGADLIITVHNVTQVTSDTITLSDGEYCEEDSTINLEFGLTDVLALQVTQVGSAIEGGDLQIVFEYILQ